MIENGNYWGVESMVWLCSTVVANALRALANGFN